jgi:ribonuclease HII
MSFYIKRICQYCNRWYVGYPSDRYCSASCREYASSWRTKIRYHWRKHQKTLTLEERRRELDEILGVDE